MYLGVNVIKYLRKHLEEALAAPEDQGRLPWDGTEGMVAVTEWHEREAWDGDPPERVWEFRLPASRLPILIGRGD